MWEQPTGGERLWVLGSSFCLWYCGLIIGPLNLSCSTQNLSQSLIISPRTKAL